MRLRARVDGCRHDARRLRRVGGECGLDQGLTIPAIDDHHVSHALVDRVGFVSDGGLAEVCRRLEVPPAEAYGVATFYSMLPVEPVAPTTVYRCEDLACMRRPTSNGEVLDGTRVVDAPCLGLCEQAPAALVVHSGPSIQHEVVSSPPERGSVPPPGDPSLVLFGERITPNHHKLARQFVLLDNFYVNSDVSADGHNWATAAIARNNPAARVQTANLLRPSPDNARLAYMMLASMGG